MARRYKTPYSMYKKSSFNAAVYTKIENTIKKTSNKMKTIFHAGIGAGGIHVISTLPSVDDTQKIAEILVQIIIGVATIYKILKKEKND